MIAALKSLSANSNISVISSLIDCLFFTQFEIFLALGIMNVFLIETWTFWVLHYEFWIAFKLCVLACCL